MTVIQLRARLKKEIDRLDVDRLRSAADYLRYINQPTIEERIAQGEKDIAAGKGVNWRRVRRDV